MDKLGIYSLYDRKLQEFGQLVLSRNDEAVRRMVLDAVRADASSMLAKHPDDFDLTRLGEFHPQNGFVAGMTGKPVLVCNVQDLLQAAAGPSVPRLASEA